MRQDHLSGVKQELSNHSAMLCSTYPRLLSRTSQSSRISCCNRISQRENPWNRKTWTNLDYLLGLHLCATCLWAFHCLVAFGLSSWVSEICQGLDVALIEFPRFLFFCCVLSLPNFMLFLVVGVLFLEPYLDMEKRSILVPRRQIPSVLVLPIRHAFPRSFYVQ